MVEKKTILEALKIVRENAGKRNFKQSVDFTMNLINVDMKTLKVADSVELPHGRGKDVDVAVLADGDPSLQAKKSGAHTVVTKKEISQYDTKKVRKLAEQCEWFIVQAPLMQPFASTFGIILGPRGQMPFPKDVIGPVSDPTQVITRLKRSVRVRVKDRPVVHAFVGTESMSDEELADNIQAVYKAVLSKLDKGIHSIGKMYLKTTMGKPTQLK
ncbi:MAG: 50S ribosomal protein L1 [archaeon]